MSTKVVAEATVDGPGEHDLRSVNVKWMRDGSVRIIFPTGTGPVDLSTAGIGNFRRACFAVRRRQFGP